MIELNIHDLKKYYGANQVFHSISFDLKTGERAGLIGPNGSGKTTIFKILMGLEDYQGGEISFRKGARIGFLNQIPEYGEEVVTLEVLQSAFEDADTVKKQMRELENQFIHLEGEVLERAIKNYGRLSQQYELAGGYEIETRINKISEGLEITESMLALPFRDLSGGEMTRVILGKILLEEPDILLLDEPSNHLDLAATGWLEGFLKDYKGAVLVISHDRYFLDAVVGKIIELDFDHADLYQGNYSYYVIEKERRFLIAMKNYQTEQKKIDRIEAQIERYRIWGEMRDSEKMFKRAKELEKRLEKMDTPEKPILDKRKIRLDRNISGRTGRIVLETKEICKSYDEKELLKEINLILYYQDSACIIGRNGCGKSTFIKIITGELEPDYGTVKLGFQINIGYLPQQVTFEDEEQTILEYFSRLHNITTGAARSQLAKVLFLKEDVHKKIKFLSGGEKSRLKLCSLTYEGANFLILDEPTNHLDIDSREVLEETLMNFTGTLLFVSHDRYFINKVADKIITLKDAEIKVYDGDYSYYLEEQQKEAAKESAENKESNMDNKKMGTVNAMKEMKGTKPSPCQNVKTYMNRSSRTAWEIEKEIDSLEEKIKQLETEMSLHNTDAEQLKELFEEIERTRHYRIL